MIAGIATTRSPDAATYTADAVALLVYLVDGLLQHADRVFAEAEAGEAVIHAPSTALAEVLCAVSRDMEIRGIPLSGSPDAVRQALLANGPVSLMPTAERDLEEFGRIVDEFSIPDALVVASHRARDTEAVITSDETIRNADVATIWD